LSGDWGNRVKSIGTCLDNFRGIIGGASEVAEEIEVLKADLVEVNKLWWAISWSSHASISIVDTVSEVN
jgi:hypothetical protein